MDHPAWRRLLRAESLPALLVDLDAFDRNAARLGAQVGPEQTLRIATKSIRIPALIRRLLDRGAPLRGLMTYTCPEAAFLHGQGFDDLLVAYPTVQRSDLVALREVQAAGGTVRLVVDSVDGLRAIDAAMSGAASPLRAVLEVDASLRPLGAIHVGVRRSPLRNGEDLERLLAAARELPGVAVDGLMVYEAQVAGLPDRNPFKKLLNPAAKVVRATSARAVAKRRRELVDVFARADTPLTVFNGGGTGSLTWAKDEPWLTEVTAGSGFLCPHLFDYYSNLDLEPAGFFALQVVRNPDERHATCLGGGYVASGEPGWDKVPVPHCPPGLELVPAEGAGEVQTPLKLPSGVALSPGDPVLFRHAKAGEPAERFTEALLVSAGEVVARVPTYRGQGRCFV